MDPLPDLGTLSDEELRDLIDRYVKEENQVSYRRRLLHGYIDILRAELQARKKRQYGKDGALADLDIDSLTAILANKGMPGGSRSASSADDPSSGE